MSSEEKAIRVAVVEDSAAFLRRVEALLGEVPGVLLVGTAEDAAGAKLLLGEARVDVLLLDLYLKAGSGLEVLRHVHEARLPMSVLVMTSEPSDEMRTACLSLGALDCVDKVLLPDVVHGTLQRAAVTGA
jgi:DNA-binding NarL/FixJ family response regulator